jgi:hypothetical protein
MSEPDKDRLGRMWAAVKANQPPALDDLAWYRERDRMPPGLRLVAELALEQGYDSVRMLLHPDTLTGAKIIQEGGLTVTLYPDEQPSETAREVGYDSLESAHAFVAKAQQPTTAASGLIPTFGTHDFLLR